ncbi:MAG: acyclic terpene utilization AtuA family protein [Caldimonas sp.]
MSTRAVRIGGASGFRRDSQVALAQLLAAGGLDCIVFDDLAEMTQILLAMPVRIAARCLPQGTVLAGA